jgi:aminoglycoside 3-N-acetyltransferase
MKNSDYSKKDIFDALRKIGISKGDNILIHSNLGFFGKLNEAENSEDYCKIFTNTILDIIGIDGTLIVPTFTYSFCWDQIFDIDNTTTSDCGIFSEYVRKKEKSIRSEDGIHSIAAIGKNAAHFTQNAPKQSFGKNSFWERFRKENGKICRFNLNADFNTFIHYVEKEMNVPYRFDKKFTGKMIIGGEKISHENIHFVRDLNNENTIPDLSKLELKMKEMNYLKKSNLGKGQILSYYAKDVFNIISEEIIKDPNFLIKGEFNK